MISITHYGGRAVIGYMTAFVLFVGKIIQSHEQILRKLSVDKGPDLGTDILVRCWILQRPQSLIFPKIKDQETLIIKQPAGVYSHMRGDGLLGGGLKGACLFHTLTRSLSPSFR